MVWFLGEEMKFAPLMNDPKVKNNWGDVALWEKRELAVTILCGDEFYRCIGFEKEKEKR